MLTKRLGAILKLYWESFFALFFPNYCCACGKYISNNEGLLCIKCFCELPKTNYHTYKDNPVAKIFWGRVEIQAATSYMHFVKGSKYSRMMYLFKYEGQKQVGVQLGRFFGADLYDSWLFKDVDIIIPVPLHKRKQRKRGFNQSECIARGLSKSMHREVVCDNLVRNEFTKTQTRKSRIDRWKNVSGKFRVKSPGALKDMHILLVDDVVTTGATIEACAQELLKVQGVRVSVVTLAKA